MTISEQAIHEIEIDGVRVFWSESDEPPRLAIRFRVGLGDELVSWRGITHLVEHLALSGLGHQSYWYNGVVSNTSTLFFAEGFPDQLVHFARHVTAALCALPIDRMTAELRVLESEAKSSSAGSWADHMSLRYGAQGYVT